MNVKRGDISKILRSLGLIYFTDFVRFFLEKKINNIAGVVTNGIFSLRSADLLIIGKDQEIEKYNKE